MTDRNIFKVWTLYQSMGFAFGWIFHGIISHLFTGAHEHHLSVAQLISHNISLTGMAAILLFFQHIATQKLFGISLFKYWPAYLILPTLFFWIGYYGIGMPVDIVFSFIIIAMLNGVILARHLQLKRWILLSILSSVVGIVVGTLIATPVEPTVLPLLTSDLSKHIAVFAIEGSAVGIPMAISGGWMLQRAARRTLQTPGTLIKG